MGSIVPYLLRQQWNPKRTAGLAGWWKADVGIQTATGVSSWADQSGNGRDLTQADTAKQPTWANNGPNGLPSITGDGSVDTLSSAAFTLPATGSVYLLVKQTTWGAGKTFLSGLTANTFLIRNSLLGSTPAIEGYNAPSGSFIGDNTGLALATWGVVTVIFNGASSKIQVNLGTGVTGTAGATAPDGIALFANGGLSASDCSITEVIVRSVVDSTADQEQHIRYLAKRGGISL